LPLGKALAPVAAGTFAFVKTAAAPLARPARCV